MEWWGEEMCGIRACVAAEGFERASGVVGECAGIERGGEGSRAGALHTADKGSGSPQVCAWDFGCERIGERHARARRGLDGRTFSI